LKPLPRPQLNLGEGGKEKGERKLLSEKGTGGKGRKRRRRKGRMECNGMGGGVYVIALGGIDAPCV